MVIIIVDGVTCEIITISCGYKNERSPRNIVKDIIGDDVITRIFDVNSRFDSIIDKIIHKLVAI
jgi:hypothetical protein